MSSEQDPLLRRRHDDVDHEQQRQQDQSPYAAAEVSGCGSSGSERSNGSSVSFRTAAEFVARMYRMGAERKRAVLLKPGVGAAAFLIRDAVLGEVENPAEGAYDPYSLEEQQESRKWYSTVSLTCNRFCSSRLVLQLHYVVGWTLVALTFVEPPHWCRSSHWYDFGDDDSANGCQAALTAVGVPAAAEDSGSGASATADDDAAYEQFFPNSKSMLVTTGQAHVIDACCVALLLLSTLVRIGRDGFRLRVYFRKGSARARRITSFVCLVLMVAGLATRITIHHPYTRLLILWTMMTSARRDIQVVMGVLPETFNVLALLGVFLLFYAWFGTIMFVGTEEGKQHFSSLVESMWTLYICVTTANYPDVMMPAYNDNRLTAVYFVSFMALSFFFLLNIILASVVNEYDMASEQRKMEFAQSANANLKRAFELMDVRKNGRIDRDTVMALFTILNEDFPEFRKLQDDETKLLFAILDQDGSSTITEDEFMNFGNVLLLEFVKESDYASWVQIWLPEIYGTGWYQSFADTVKSDYFEVAIDLVLVLNAVVIGIQTYPELSGQAIAIDPKDYDGEIDTVWELVETIFTSIYLLEVGVKISVFGSKAYFESPKNVFDFTITLLAVVASAIVYYPNQISNSRLIRMIVMARVLRLVRLLTALKGFQLIGSISAEILPRAVGVFLVLFSLLYLFAAVGVGLYGGLITRDPSNPLSYLVLNTDFSDNDYWYVRETRSGPPNVSFSDLAFFISFACLRNRANNFNDMVSAMNVLFNLLVVNNWTECEIGYEATTQSRWVRLYFLAFHILGVILINNLVIAFIINAFLQQLAIFQAQSNEEVVDGEAVIANRRARFNASTITGTKTGLTGEYMVRYRRTNSERSDEHEQERLRRLFTQTSSLGGDKSDPSISKAPSVESAPA